MRFDDKLYVQVTSGEGYDDDLNPVEPQAELREFGECVVMPNNKASEVSLSDGKKYIYQYEVIAPIKPKHYYESLIPKEGEQVRVVKADGTIDVTAFCRGRVTYKKRYLKIWI